MHGRDGDIQVHAVRHEDDKDTDGRRRQIRAGLSAACFAEGISESPVLRLDGVQLSDHTRSCEVAGVAVSGLDVLARQRSRSAAGTVRTETSAV